MPRTSALKRENEALRAQLSQCLSTMQQAAAREAAHVRAALGSAIEAILDPVFLHDPEGRIVQANRAYLELAERALGDVLGRPYWEVYPRGDGPTPGCLRALAEGGAQEEEIAGPQGRVLRMRSFAIRPAEAASPQHSLHVLEDVTERKRWEEALRAGEERLRLALRAGQAGIWDWDVRSGTVVWSPEAYELYGFDPALGPPKPDAWERRLHPDDRAATMQAIRDVIEGRAAEYRIEFRINHPHAGLRWLLGIGRVENGSRDGCPRLLGITLDVTERRRTEESLRRVNSELERFTYAASHDLKAPLRAIHRLSSCIEQEVVDHLSEEGRRQMALLRDRVRLMDDLINALLDYSRAGAPPARIEEVAVAELLDEVIAAVRVPRGFTIIKGPDLPSVRTDRRQLRQVFANLIGNAVGYHDREDGRIQITAGGNDGYCEFAVADDGPGIAPEYQRRLFELFQPRSGGKPGVPIGLAVTRRLVESVGGRITLESAPGRGSVFRFTWPKALPDPTGDARPEETHDDGGGLAP